MLSLFEFKEGCMIEIHYEMEHFSVQLKFFLHRKFYLWLCTKSSRTYILLHIWQLIMHFILMTRWAVWAVELTYGYLLLRIIWVARIGQLLQLIGTSWITNEHINFEIVVIHYHYWRLSVCYGTRTGFRTLSISQSPCDEQKLEIVVTNAYPTFVQHVD